MQSIKDLIPSVDNDDIKSELKEEYSGYENFINKISAFMKENGLDPKDINPFKKAMMWSAIKMNAATDNSPRHIAEMMIRGTVTGITCLKASLTDSEQDMDEEIKALLCELISMEESFENRLKRHI